MSEQLAFKAGRAFRREGTNTVDPSPTKGAIILANGEDGLLHFMWKNRVSNNVDEDLILFPSDATFVRVSQSSGRVYVLKFSSSNQRHFFWLQDSSTRRDDEIVDNVNRLLRDPDSIPIWNPNPAEGSEAQASTSFGQFSATAPQRSTSQDFGSGTSQVTSEQLAQLQSLVASMSGNPPQELSLADILTPANLSPLFTSHPELVSALFPHLPPDLPTPPSVEVLQRIISSPQFRSAVQSFDQALQTGMLGGLVRGLGLPDEAGTGVEAFLRAVQEQAGRNAADSMDTD